MRIVFMGSSDIACPALEMLLSRENDTVVGVVTQPDRPKGRGRKVVPSPVRQCVGDRAGVLTPEDVNSCEAVDCLRALTPDLFVIVAFGQILKRSMLAIPPLGCVNLHPSLLPKYRGAAPIPWAIANGERTTGVTTMYINERMDAGDLILQRETPIAPSDTGGTLTGRLALEGACLLSETVDRIHRGDAPRIAQDESRATYATKLSKADGGIDWTMPALLIHNRVRAFNPWPGSFCEAPSGSGRLLKVLATAVEDGRGSAPGRVLSWSGGGPLVQAGTGAIRILGVQPEGRRAMSGADYVRGHPQVEML